jgi:hypothetical protein
MNRNSLAFSFLAATIVFGMTDISLLGQIHLSATGDESVRRITIYPAPEPQPALRYQLLPPMLERIPGNAAVHYGKLTAANIRFLSDPQLLETASNWSSTPLANLRRQEVRASAYYRSIRNLPGLYDQLQRAARCEQCDWQLPIREDGYFSMLLPEVQQTRTLATLLAAKARLEIADGQYEQALRTLQIGYALGRHVAEGQTLINTLVGAAIANLMSGVVLECIQQPDAPNLYWALAMLPQPPIDWQGAIEVELNGVFLHFPFLRELDSSERSAAYWRESLQTLLQETGTLAGKNARESSAPWLPLLIGMTEYPAAKRFLLQRGMSHEQVEAMPVAQVILLTAKHRFETVRDEMFKWAFLPYWQAKEGMDRSEQLLRQASSEQVVTSSLCTFLPAIKAVQIASVRLDREIAVLMILEALRMYAAEHNGQLPETLAQLRVPAPIDPVNGQPFGYQLRDGVAVIQGPPLPGMILHLEVRIAKPEMSR